MLRALLLLILFAAASPAAAFDVKAGTIHGDDEAAVTCPRLCKNYGGWDKRWLKSGGGKALCRCAAGPIGKDDEANGGPAASDSKAAWACVGACEHYGGWSRSWRSLDGQVVCSCNRPLINKNPPS